MNDTTTKISGTQTEHLDVLILGAGISGIAAAYHLQQQCRDKKYLILESQESFGGTWLTNTYPGVRSDSDLFTFGYGFKPWSGAPIASGDEICNYLEEAIAENNITDHIRYQHGVKTATWSSENKYWTLIVLKKDTGESLVFTTKFLLMCTGYFRHSKGYTPDFRGVDSYKGKIVHPQSWPNDLNYKGKRVVVIGSGATAATLIPAMADDCEHITMLQRSPTYFMPLENKSELADTLRELDIPEEWSHEIVRRKMLLDGREQLQLCAEQPELAKTGLLEFARSYLGDDFDIDKHFTPKYRPWQQRVAVVPDGDLFQCITSGKASVVTDEIETLTERGILLKSGETLEADIIITATGLDICVGGDIDIQVDGKPFCASDCWTYRGNMFSGVPNMSLFFGYLRSSYTLRIELLAKHICRLLNHMDAKGVAVVTPQLREQDLNMPAKPFFDSEDINSGYLMRSMHLFPKQGDCAPWIYCTDYYAERHELPVCDLDDGALVYK
jgi:cation diffusion facilitator CzcD-associated flavoprotein CzcO